MSGFEIVSVVSGAKSVRSLECGQTFHPVTGPMAEAEALYVAQQRLVERAAACAGNFVIWDVGLGAGANAIAAINALSRSGRNISIHSFDKTTEPIRFALQHADELGYIVGHEDSLRGLVSDGCAVIADGGTRIEWRLHTGNFSEQMEKAEISAPAALLYDPYSPTANIEMWTLEHFTRLRQRLDDAVPCLLTNYTRSTAVRVTLLLAGFYVGEGHGIGEKEKTTAAANTPELIEEPLDVRWLERVARSTSAAPLRGEIFSQGKIPAEDLERLKAHPQFSNR